MDKTYMEVAAQLNGTARTLLNAEQDTPSIRALLLASRIQLVASEAVVESMRAEAGDD